jgi:hypothetical protein
MAYRDDQRCHICGAETRVICPRCENAVCAEHTLAGRVEGGSAGARAEAERLARRLGGTDACTACVERELEASQGPFVPILRSSDPIETQMVVEALLEEGFDARSIGTQNAALLGAGQGIFEQRVEVPEPQAEAARELASSLLVEEADEEADEDGGADATPGRQPLRRRGVAAGLAFIFPGASHYYARHPWTGLVLTLTFFAGFFLLAQGAERAAIVLIGGVPLLDLITGQLAVGAYNRGSPRSVAVQLVQGAAMAAVLVLVALLFFNFSS